MSAPEAIDLLRRSCMALRLQVPASIADDVSAKAEAVIAEHDRIWEVLDTIGSNNDIGCRHCYQMAEDAHTALYPRVGP